MDDESVLWEETIEPGATWSHVLKRGTSLRMVDLEGGANVGAIFYNFECPAERYNMADTLKAQHLARLTEGCVLYSDMGRILCSIIKDTAGWHDPIRQPVSELADLRLRVPQYVRPGASPDYPHVLRHREQW